MPNTTTRLLDRYKEVLGITSDYEAAKRLDVTRATISRWRKGFTMDDATALKIAEELGIAPPLAVLAEVNLDRRLSTRDRRIWERYRARVSVAALAALLAALQFPSATTSISPQTASEPFNNVYIMRRRVQRSIARIQTAFRRCRLQRLRPLAAQVV